MIDLSFCSFVASASINSVRLSFPRTSVSSSFFWWKISCYFYWSILSSLLYINSIVFSMAHISISSIPHIVLISWLLNLSVSSLWFFVNLSFPWSSYSYLCFYGTCLCFRSVGHSRSYCRFINSDFVFVVRCLFL